VPTPKLWFETEPAPAVGVTGGLPPPSVVPAFFTLGSYVVVRFLRILVFFTTLRFLELGTAVASIKFSSFKSFWFKTSGVPAI